MEFAEVIEGDEAVVVDELPIARIDIRMEIALNGHQSFFGNIRKLHRSDGDDHLLRYIRVKEDHKETASTREDKEMMNATARAL